MDTVSEFANLCRELGGWVEESPGEVWCHVEPYEVLRAMDRLRGIAEEHVEREGEPHLTIGNDLLHIVVVPRGGVERHLDLPIRVWRRPSEKDTGRVCQSAYDAVLDAVARSVNPVDVTELVDFTGLDIIECTDREDTVIVLIQTGSIPPKEMWRVEKLLGIAARTLPEIIARAKKAAQPR